MANEKRLIDANALQFEPDPWGGMNGVICLGRSGGKTMATVQAALKRMIDNAPTVDAVEVVHGRWEIKEYPITGCKKITCSICSYWVDRGPAWNKNWGFHHYCPNCGAKMDGGNEDGG